MKSFLRRRRRSSITEQARDCKSYTQYVQPASSSDVAEKKKYGPLIARIAYTTALGALFFFVTPCPLPSAHLISILVADVHLARICCAC